MRPELRNALRGPSLVAAASLLWGMDALFRLPASRALRPEFVVFLEHLFGFAAIAPWIWRRERGRLTRLSAREWACALVVGVGGSAGATTLFTLAFRFVSPSVAILLQKLQPVFVVLVARATLGEHPRPKFYPWAAVALCAAVVLSFPDLDFGGLRGARGAGIALALAAAAAWGVSTVAGKYLLRRQTPETTTFWRYGLGLAALGILLRAQGASGQWGALFASGALFGQVLALSLLCGVLPMWTYYAGLARTSAGVTTFVELLYPLSAVALNFVWLGVPLTAIQLAAGAVLLTAVTAIAI